MKLIPIFAFLLLAVTEALCQTQITGNGLSGSFTIGTTGILPGCASLATIIPPTIAPFSGLLGAGTLVANPEPANYITFGCFGTNNPIARVSDAMSGPNACIAQGGTCPSENNQSMFVNGGDGEDNQWSIDDSQFSTVTSGGQYLIWNFTPSTMASSVRYTNAPANTIKMWKQPIASRVTAKKWYSFSNSTATGDGLVLNSYDTSTSWPTLPTRTTLYDFGSSVNGVPASYTFKADAVSINQADTVFLDGFSNSGTQNTAIYAAAYKAGSGVSTYNTQTGVVTGDFGTTGSIVCQNCPGAATDPGHFTLHNVKMSLDGTYAALVTSTCFTTCYATSVPYIWQIGTTKIWVICIIGSGTGCTGHGVEGFQTYQTNYDIGYYASYLYTNTSSTKYPTGGAGGCAHGALPTVDTHPSWWNNTGSDQECFITSTTTSTSNPVYNACNVAEITCNYTPANVSLSGTVLRFAHTYEAATSEFAVNNALVNVSQTGKFAIFTSPMANSSTYLGQLGSTGGIFPCTVQANCRGDVFVVKLQ